MCDGYLIDVLEQETTPFALKTLADPGGGDNPAIVPPKALRVANISLPPPGPPREPNESSARCLVNRKWKKNKEFDTFMT